ncbi:hypothetical protein [Indiicoccus explosivorum]|uniref:hypothetical protein n=1 Tax=Indiicoccus explosivorum TaxID=1917864 RepID=UPI000B4515D6|nr:hypothetical protein [Indiicoccus explosivorum]
MAKKLTKLEQYNTQKQQTDQQVHHLNAVIGKADEEYQTLKAQYEAKVRENVLQGVDDMSEADRLADAVEAAEKVCRRRREEFASMQHVREVMTVTPEDVIEEYHAEIAPKFKASKVTPALERIRAAKIAYAEAILAYNCVKREFVDFESEYKESFGESYKYRFGRVLPEKRAEFDHYFLRSGDLDRLERDIVPDLLKSEVQY